MQIPGPIDDLSTLFLAIIEGRVRDNPSIISESLIKGEGIKNGEITAPIDPAKLFTQYAHADNLKHIFNILLQKIGPMIDRDIILEVGSGDGYLKYLLSILNDPIADFFIKRLIETEPSQEKVNSNMARGKVMVQAGISDLPLLFGESFTPCIVSMNVMDTFYYQSLKYNMGIVRRVLKEGGMFLHIMSSSIHPSVFSDIKNRFPNSVFLPYHNDRHIGVRIVTRENLSQEASFLARQLPEDLCKLFAEQPEQFIILADAITDIFSIQSDAGIPLLFEDYSLEKIKSTLMDTGFRLVLYQQISSSILVDRLPHHQMIPDANSFNNLIGALSVDTVSIEGMETHNVRESATFWVVMGQAV